MRAQWGSWRHTESFPIDAGWVPNCKTQTGKTDPRFPKVVERQRKEQRVWGQWYRQEGKWEMENRISPQNLGGGGIIATKGKCLKEGCCQLCQYRGLFLKMWF